MIGGAEPEADSDGARACGPLAAMASWPALVVLCLLCALCVLVGCSSCHLSNGVRAGDATTTTNSVLGTALPTLPPVVLAQPGEALLVGAGDIASCDGGDDEKTGRLVERVLSSTALPPERAWAFTLGDNAYPSGTLEQFVRCYEPAWGRFKDRTLPVVGNHDYRTAGAAGYRATFAARLGAKGPFWFSHDVPVGTPGSTARWHVVVLDSNCDEIDCSGTGPQADWLRDDLRASGAACTVALMHHPRFSSGPHGNRADLVPLYDVLVQGGVELLLTGHDHIYERFAPLLANGERDERFGIVNFVVGTGGRSHYDLGEPRAGSLVRFNDQSGVIVLHLAEDSYRWNFVDVTGAVRDAGQGRCHPPPGDE